ncbi:hypothetical protein JCM11641_001521 [Rhodosporidiobolus odoratus]
MAQPTPTLHETPSGPSPLKQVNQSGAPPPKSKLEASWEQLSTVPDLFTRDHAPTPARYFADFFCLRPHQTWQAQALDRLRNEDLKGPFRNNISQLFKNAIKVLKEAERKDISRTNVVETLLPFLRHILSRGLDSHSLLVMLAGSVEQSDQVFGDLVSTIDTTLQDKLAPLRLRHRILQLALVFVASVNEGAHNAYFLRRDLFSTLVSFIADGETRQFAFESTLLLGLLASYRKEEARNPYGVRIEDFVEEGVMTRIIEVVETVCTSARDCYVSLADDVSTTLTSSITSFLTSFRITEILAAPFAQATPSSPSKPPLPTLDKQPPVSPPEGKLNAETASSSAHLPSSDAPKSSHPRTSTPQKPSTSSCSPSAMANGVKPIPQPPPASLRTEDKPFEAMPPEMLVLLLPLFELMNSNKTFCSLLFAETPDATAPALPSTLISLSSYVFCHAAVTSRSRIYSRLFLILLLILVEEGEGKLAVAVPDEIRLCRQRHPVLPDNGPVSMPLAAIVDTVVIFLRYNLREGLDVESYTIALRLLQRVLQQLKTEKLRLERDWVNLWRSILGLASFVVSNIAELRDASDQIDALISQIFVTLAYAAFWAESILPSSSAHASLFYETLQAEQTLSSLSDHLGISSVTSPAATSPSGPSTPPRTKATAISSYNRRDTPSRTSFFALSPTRSAFGSTPAFSPISAFPTSPLSGSGGGFVATECISSLRSASTFFTSHIQQLGSKKPRKDQILAVIEKNLGGVEMIESAAMADLGRFAVNEERGMNQYFRELTTVACTDTLQLMQSGNAE